MASSVVKCGAFRFICFIVSGVTSSQLLHVRGRFLDIKYSCVSLVCSIPTIFRHLSHWRFSILVLGYLYILSITSDILFDCVAFHLFIHFIYMFFLCMLWGRFWFAEIVFLVDELSLVLLIYLYSRFHGFRYRLVPNLGWIFCY